ncbi:EF-hand domain-containing protein [Phenylobacterium sp.]|uniref:EF-hand domain-containing protein n=1 Tax=Phenylobacterium sp. TaxID=1871053 RepID=UPI00356AB0D5
MPGADQTATSATPPTTTQPAGGPNAAQFTADTLSSLLSAQEAPPTSADVAAKVIGTADANGDGALSLDEVEKALGQDTTTGADALSQAFAKVDTNGDGQVDANELTSALDAQKSASGAHHAHHAHHAHQSAPSSSDLASNVLGALDTDGDGELSAGEIQTALGSKASDTLTSAIGNLDTDADGKLSASELSTAIDAFRAAHHRGAPATSTAAQPAQVVAA